MWLIPKANVEGVNFLDNQFIPVGMLFNILLHVYRQIVLTLYLLSDDSPSVSFQVGPKLNNVDDSTALQSLIAYIQSIVV